MRTFPLTAAPLRLLALSVLSACASSAPTPPAPEQGQPLVLRWQRLVDQDGATCQRCGLTEAAVDEAEAALRPVLAPLGLRLQVEKQALGVAAFQADPASSNRVWIDGQPIETLLGGTVGASKCCDSCGDNDCRTLSVDGTTREAIPTDWIVRAAVIAAAARLRGTPAASEAPPAAGCCTSTSGCCSGDDAPRK
jgi:hypothetical protein